MRNIIKLSAFALTLVATAASAQAVIAMLEPIQTRYYELLNDQGELMRLLHKGNGRAKEVASKTLSRAQKAIGFLSAE
jgi:tryptophanyl-tRNA synthetase